jgi:hypothetical protein
MPPPFTGDARYVYCENDEVSGEEYVPPNGATFPRMYTTVQPSVGGLMGILLHIIIDKDRCTDSVHT